ncbi:ribonuclease HI [Lipingzhangella halophila]|uniref:Ribonuclease HI n=1 Tax=Lipingzhangella halophila TaxID=1783352 RepID=A0A7W7RDV0_9ACTN|nr:nuclear transport factor 2 family protein [Lipingzhangella halophila]MBB4930187.1 ribonuclease HI [Lipingzhangella halophila]
MADDSAFDTVIAGELRLLDPEVRRDADAVRALLHEDFREFGASGTRWDRRSVVRATRSDTAERSTAEGLHPVRLGPDAVLLTYTARRARSASLRTSVWVRSGGQWRLLHHQGTPLPGPPH